MQVLSIIVLQDAQGSEMARKRIDRSIDEHATWIAKKC